MIVKDFGAGIGSIIEFAVLGRANQHKWDNCMMEYKLCRTAFDRREGQRVLLADTAFWAFVGAGAVGGATAIYALTGKSSASKRTGSGALMIGIQGSGVLVRGSF